MGETTQADFGTGETCPDRPHEPGPDGHGTEWAEQPDDMDAFYVHRCVWCGKVFERYDTEEAFLEEFGPDADPDVREATEHTADFGGLFK